MGQNRDEFSKPTKAQLAAETGYLCARCEKGTHYYCPQAREHLHIGNAAHDAAAAPGGPRYDADMTPQQRRSAENGAWLCVNCATLVDVAEDDFPPGDIAQFQRDAIERRKQAVHQTPVRERPTYDAKAAQRAIGTFVGRIGALSLFIVKGWPVEVSFGSAQAIRDLVKDCAWLDLSNALSAQFPQQVTVQRRIVESLRRIEREVTRNKEAWGTDYQGERYVPQGTGLGFRLPQQAVIDQSVERVRASWADVDHGRQQLAEFARELCHPAPLTRRHSNAADAAAGASCWPDHGEQMNQATPVWEAFDAAACWWAGAMLWLWEASWDAPRLAVANADEGGVWHYQRGGTVGAGGEPSPTHCSVLVAPLPPQRREAVGAHAGPAGRR